MAAPEKPPVPDGLFYDPEFRRLEPARQRRLVRDFDPGFGKLPEGEQDEIIRRKSQVLPSQPDLGLTDAAPGLDRFAERETDSFSRHTEKLKGAQRQIFDYVEGLPESVPDHLEKRLRQVGAMNVGPWAGNLASGAEFIQGSVDALTDTEWDDPRGRPITQDQRDEVLEYGLGPRRLKRQGGVMDEFPGSGRYLIGPVAAKQVYDVTVPRTAKMLLRGAQSVGWAPEGEPVRALQDKVGGWAKRLREVEAKHSQYEHPELDIAGPVDELVRGTNYAVGTVLEVMATGGILGAGGRKLGMKGLQHVALPLYEAMIARGRGGDTMAQLKGAGHGALLAGGLALLRPMKPAIARTAFGAMLFGGGPTAEAIKGGLPWEEAFTQLLIGGYFGYKGGTNPRANLLDEMTPEQMEALNRMRPEDPAKSEPVDVAAGAREKEVGGRVVSKKRPVAGDLPEGEPKPPPPVDVKPEPKPPALPPGPEPEPRIPGTEPPGALPEPKPSTDFENVGPREYPPGHVPALRPWVDGSEVRVDYGNEVTVSLPTGKDVRAVYVVTDLYDLVASHEPEDGFRPNFGYPQPYQGKDYADTSKGYANEVLMHSSDVGKNRWNPQLTLHHDPTAIGGTPMGVPDRFVTSGNGRKMVINERYRKHPRKTKGEMVVAAPEFGLKEETVRSYKQPIIWRLQLSDIPQSPTEAAALSNVLNASFTAAPTGEANAAGLAARMGDRSYTALDNAIAKADPTSTLNDTLLNDKDLPAALIADGVITENEKALYIGDDGKFTGEGRKLVGEMVYAGIVPDAKLRDRVPDTLRNKLQRVSAPVLRAKAFGGERVQQLLDAAIESELGRRSKKGKKGISQHLDDFVREGGLALEGAGAYPSQLDPMVAAMHRTLAPGGWKPAKAGEPRAPSAENRGGMTELEAKAVWVRFGELLSQKNAGQGTLFGGDESGQVTFESAFDQAFSPDSPVAHRPSELPEAVPIFSQPSAADADAGAGKPLPPDIWDGVRTGLPIKITAWHASGREDFGSAYAEGAEGPTLGPGIYSGMSADDVRQFGPDVKPRTVKLENPYVLESDEQLRELAGVAGLPMEIAGWNEVLPLIREAITGAGHDGVIVNVRRYRDFDEDAGVKGVKRLREVFGHSQTVEFTPEALAPVGPTGEALPPDVPMAPAPSAPRTDDPAKPEGEPPKVGDARPHSYPVDTYPEWEGPIMWAAEETTFTMPDGARPRTRVAVLEQVDVDGSGLMAQGLPEGSGDLVMLPDGVMVGGSYAWKTISAMPPEALFDLVRSQGGISQIDPSEAMGRFDRPVVVHVLLEGIPESAVDVAGLTRTLHGVALPPSAIEPMRIGPGPTGPARRAAPATVAGPEGALDAARSVPPLDREGPPDVDAGWMPGWNFQGMPDYPRDTPTQLIPKRVKKRGDILHNLAKATGVPIQQGRMPRFPGREEVYGYRVQGTGELRIRYWGDIAVAAHEIGHHFAKEYPSIQEMFKPTRDPDTGYLVISEIGKELQGVSYDMRQPEEGFTEFLRHWMTNKDHAQSVAPNSLARWEEILRNEFPRKHRKALFAAQRDMHRYFGQGAGRSIKKLYGDPGRNPSDSNANLGDRMRETIADDFQGILMMERKLLDGAPVPDGAYETARNLRGLGDTVAGLFRHGHIEWRRDADGKLTGESDYVGESLEEILLPVSKTYTDSDKFFAYLDATRAMMLKQEGRERLFSKDQIEEGLSYVTPERKLAAEKLNEFAKALLKYSYEGGAITKRVYELLADPENWHPISFYRELGQANKFGKEGNALTGYSGVNSLWGSSRNLKHPIERLMENYARLIQAARENVEKGKIATLFKSPGGGAFGAPIASTSKAVRVKADEFIREFQKTLKREGVEVPEGFLEAEGMIDYVTLFMGGEKPFGDNIMVHLTHNGPEYFEVFDPMVMRSIQSMRRPMMNLMLRMGDALRRFQQGAVVTTADFVGINLIRDVALSSMTTKTGHQLFTALPRGMASAAMRDKHLQDAIANGGSGDTLRLRGHREWQAAAVRMAQRKGLDPRGFFFGRRLTPIGANPADVYKAISWPGWVIENTPRMGEFIREKDQGGTSTHASYLKAEISTDFRMEGTYYTPGGRFLRGFLHQIPFGNPMIVGTDKIYRNIGRDPTKKAETAIRMGIFGLMALANHIDQKDHEEIKNLPDWDRLGNLHRMVPLPPEAQEWAKETFGETSLSAKGELHLRIPTIWEVGMIANMGATMYDYLADSNDPSEVQLAKDIAFILSQNFGMSLPPWAGIGYQQIAGKDFFTQSQIESPYDKAEKWTRTRTKQGPAIRDFGKHVLQPVNAKLEEMDAPEWMQQSPAQAEAVLHLMLSTWTMYGLAVADKLVDPNAPTKPTDDLPLIRRLMERRQEYSNVPEQYYEMLNSVEETYATWSKLSMLDDDAVDRYENAHEDEIDAAKVMGRVQRNIQDFDAQIRELYAVRDGLKSPDEKGRELEQLRLGRLEEMREGLEIGEEMGLER
ncbi:MAG: LPD38 domain-containing protein [Gemmatimonadota bacterium]